MIEKLKRVVSFRSRRIRVVESTQAPKILIAKSCLLGIQHCLGESQVQQHEGVAFLLGRAVRNTALCVQAVKPKAVTTPGSFQVSAAEMAKVIDVAIELDLQIVAQIHSHPEKAFHSTGDEKGANIRFPGFISIVIPRYGALLPDFLGSAAFIFTDQGTWERIASDSIRVLASEVIL